MLELGAYNSFKSGVSNIRPAISFHPACEGLWRPAKVQAFLKKGPQSIPIRLARVWVRQIRPASRHEFDIPDLSNR